MTDTMTSLLGVVTGATKHTYTQPELRWDLKLSTREGSKTMFGVKFLFKPAITNFFWPLGAIWQTH